LLWSATDARAFHGVDTARTGGAVAREAHPDGADQAVLARAGDFADALAAAPVTRNPDGPLLLTPRDELAEPTRRALTDLGVEQVTIVGGAGAVSDEVAAAVEEVAAVERVAGPNRFATAVAVTHAIGKAEGRTVGALRGRRTAFVVSGRRFPDAVAASAAAASATDPFPILLTEPDRLPEATRRALDNLEIPRAIVVGGPDAVSERVEAQLADAQWPSFIQRPRFEAHERLVPDDPRLRRVAPLLAGAERRRDAPGRQHRLLQLKSPPTAHR
jgi:putative cell wall-binding protein